MNEDPAMYTLLGSYLKYSDDLKIRNGTIFAGRDRSGPGRFDTFAAIWTGEWVQLPDLSPTTTMAVA